MKLKVISFWTIVCLLLITVIVLISCSKKDTPERAVLEAEVLERVALGDSVVSGQTDLAIIEKEIKVLSDAILKDLIDLQPNEKLEAINRFSPENFISGYVGFIPYQLRNDKAVLSKSFYEVFDGNHTTTMSPIIDIFLLRSVVFTDTLAFIKMRHEVFRTGPKEVKPLITEFGATERQATEMIQNMNNQLNADYHRAKVVVELKNRKRGQNEH